MMTGFLSDAPEVSDDGNHADGDGRWSRRRFLESMAAAGAAVATAGGLTALDAAAPAFARSDRATLDASASTLTMAIFQEPDTLDPAASGLVGSGDVYVHVLDPLVWKLTTSRGPEYFPGLATSYHISKDAKTYTFKLRKGVKFHDGTPFNAHAVKFNMDHIVNPATKSRSAASSLGPYKETKVINDYTCQIIFKVPNAAFASEMTGVTWMSSPTAIKKSGSNYGRHPVGTGPYIFKSWVAGDAVTIERNPHYKWGPAPLGGGKPAKLKTLVFRILPDPSAQYNALQTGEITLAQNLAPQDVQQALADPKFKKYIADSTGMPYCFMVNAKKSPTDDLRVRQALEYATNQEAIIKTLFFGLYDAANSLFCPNTPGYSKDQALYHYNPTKAGRLLDEAGWKKNSKGVRSKNGNPLHLDLINISGYGFDGISQVLQAQFKAVGIQTAISDQSFPAVAATYNRGDQHIADFFYTDVDPYFTHALFDCSQIKSGFNWEHYCNPKVDQMIDKANTIPNAKKRVALYRQIGKELMQAAVIIPIYNLRNVFVGPNSIRGIVFTTSATPLFHNVTF